MATSGTDFTMAPGTDEARLVEPASERLSTPRTSFWLVQIVANQRYTTIKHDSYIVHAMLE